MSTTELNYGTIDQAVSITLNSLADNSIRQSASISNTTNKFVEVLVSGILEGAASADGYARIFAYGRVEASVYSGGASGSDAAYTDGTGGADLRNLAYLGTAFVPSATTDSYAWGPFPLTRAFGVVPDEWGVVIQWVDSGTSALHSSGNEVNYQGIKYDQV